MDEKKRLRKETPIPELVKMIDRDAAGVIGNHLPGMEDDGEFMEMMHRNTVRIVAVNGIIDGRDDEVFDYLSSCGNDLLDVLRGWLEEDLAKDNDPVWTDACRKIADWMDAKEERDMTEKKRWVSIEITDDEIRRILDEREGGRKAGRGDSPYSQEFYEETYGIRRKEGKE